MCLYLFFSAYLKDISVENLTVFFLLDWIFVFYRRFLPRRTRVRLSVVLVFAKDRIRSLGFALKSPMRFGEEQSALAHLQENLQIRFV